MAFGAAHVLVVSRALPSVRSGACVRRRALRFELGFAGKSGDDLLELFFLFDRKLATSFLTNLTILPFEFREPKYLARRCEQVNQAAEPFAAGKAFQIRSSGQVEF